jgi:hypothetical protein
MLREEGPSKITLEMRLRVSDLTAKIRERSIFMLASPFLFPAVLVAGLVLAVNNTSGAYMYVDFQSSFLPYFSSRPD